MDCAELVEVVTSYIEGTMAAEDVRRFEAHLEECAYCGTYLEQMREVAATMGGLDEDSLSPAVREELLQAFSGWRSPPSGA
jgi:predicted anti-sigma-YlaC factor YlaD